MDWQPAKHHGCRDGDSGLLIASSLPACESGFEPYDAWCGSELLVNKGILWARFPQHRAVVINTHMQARDDPLQSLLHEGRDALETYREQQARPPIIQYGTRVLVPLLDSLMFGRVLK